MSFQTIVIEKLNAIIGWMNETITASKTNEQLPVQATLVPSSLVRVSNAGVSQSLTIQKIIDATSSAPIPYLSLKIEAKGHQNGVANFSSSLERGDYVTGVKEGDIVWLWARYNGGDPNNRENYSPGFENELPPLL